MVLLPLECKYVTSECIRELKSANASPQAKPMQTDIDLFPARFVYELCWTVVRGELPGSKCRIALESVGLLEGHLKEETASLLADNVAHMGLELAVPGEFRSRLVELAKWLVEAGLVPPRFLQERCEAEFLWEADMIKIKAPELKSKEVRVNTRLLYQQTKFNLLREESEGYAKLLTVLSQSGGGHGVAIVSTIKSLIGHFDLDPNRVFDLVLEYFELHPENHVLLNLVPLFPKSHLCHILGFKFQYYQRQEVEQPVPPGLYKLAATLIKESFVDLDSIYAHLVPRDEEAVEQYEEHMKKRLEEANKIGKINLAATGKDLEEEKSGDVTVDLYAALDTEAEAAAARLSDVVTNQKLGLLDGFLTIGDWPHAHILFERLASLNPAAHEEISRGLLRVLGDTIAPCYDRLRPTYLSKGGSGQDPTNKRPPVIELKKDCFQMLQCIGPYLYRDVLLLQKVCKVLRAYYISAMQAVTSTRNQEAEHKDAKAALKDVRLKLEEALGGCLLPALQLLPANPAVCMAIWEVMSLFPYEVRYRLYGEWEKEEEPLPVLLVARQMAKLDTRRILKRLAKENLKQLGRMLAKVAHANPMTVLRTILLQMEAYKDMIAPVVDAFKYLTQLEYDVLEYVVLERLALGGREKLKEDGLNLSDWLQSLASFWGHLCKKYPSMELRGLFQYLVNQLKKGEGIELVILQELVQQMANVEHIENVTEDQLEALAGGETLRYHATAFGMTKNNKALIKSTNRLRDALLSKDDLKLAVPLLVLIAQHRTNVINKAEGPHVKMISEQYDRTHGILLQYVEFLNVAVAPSTAYAQLIPSLDDLVHKYHLEPEAAFLIYRPVLGLVTPAKMSEGSGANGHAEEQPVTRVTRADILAVVQSMLPQKAWISLSPELYLTFWELSLHDLYVPKKRYELEISKQRSSLKSLEENSDNTYAAIAKRKKDKEKIQEVLDRLTSELEKQEQNVAAVHQRLAREKDSWLTSCSDSPKINMEFLQRCIFPRCVFSMADAVYCAKFVHTLHSLGTPFFNTVNHIDSLICKALQPLVSCCTEYEAGRLGRFLLETLKMAYHWKSDEAVYDRECGNMPGFGLYYRDPQSLKVTFKQFIQVHWKWNARLTRLMVQCLESSDYMEIRNALTVLTKLSSVFPVTKKTGGNIEKRVYKIKQDEREDLKVLATAVSAALASRKSAWVSDESFVMGYTDILKAPPAPKPPVPPTSAPTDGAATPATAATPRSAAASIPQSASADPKQPSQFKSRSNGADTREEDASLPKATVDDEARPRKSMSTSSSPTARPSSKVEPALRDEGPPVPVKMAKTEVKEPTGSESRQRLAQVSHSTVNRGATRPAPLQDVPKTRDTSQRTSELKVNDRSDVYESGSNYGTASARSPSHRDEAGDKERQMKRSALPEDPERFSKRRKGDGTEVGEIRNPDRWSAERPRSADYDKSYDEKPRERLERPERPDRSDRPDRPDRPERDYRSDRERGDREEYAADKSSSRDRQADKLARDRSVDRSSDRNADRTADRNSERNSDWVFDRLGRDERLKDDRGRLRHTDSTAEQSHGDDRFGQGLPPPPPIPPNLVPHSIRREEEDRRRAAQRLSSPHRDDKRRAEEASAVMAEESKRRREEDSRERKREELLKADKERERAKEEAEAALSKRRKLKRDHLATGASDAYLPPAPQLAPSQPASTMYDRDRKALPQPRSMYEIHSSSSKEPPPPKLARRDEQMYDREWEEEKRQRAELKRRHHSSSSSRK